MNDHDDIRKQLSAYCGGDLEPAERMRVEAHLAGCASCRAGLSDLQTALRLIRTTPESEPPAWLATRIMARVREQQREKPSWRHRIFFPLHVKLPIEVVALLLVCVSGYYLARTVETGLKQPAIRQEIPAATPETGAAGGAHKQAAPATVPPASAPPPAAKKELRPQESMPAEPSVPKGADQAAPHYAPPVSGTSPQPAFAPAPPVTKEERGAPAAEPWYGGAPSSQPDRVMKATHQAKKAKKIKDLDTDGNDSAISGMPRGAAGVPLGSALPQVRVRLEMTAPASAPGALKEAVTRSGGSVIDDGLARPNAIKARMPSARLDELLEHLGRLGRVVERPQARDLPGMVELEIVW